MQIGVHIGGSQDDLARAINFVKKNNIKILQIFISDPNSYLLNIKPIDEYWELYDLVDILYIHSPFWVSFFDTNVLRDQAKFLDSIRRFFVKDKPIRYVTHVGYPKNKEFVTEGGMMQNIINILDKDFNIEDTSVKIFLENDAGKIGFPNLSIYALCVIANCIGINVCLDTEHAYAAGDDLLKLVDTCNRQNITTYHLNGIPYYVNFGGTLDRHSYTTLQKSKPIILNFLNKLNNLNEKIFILERRDEKIMEDDIKFLQNKFKGEN